MELNVPWMGGRGHTNKKRKRRRGTDLVAYLSNKKWSLEETEGVQGQAAEAPPDLNIAPIGTFSGLPSGALHYKTNVSDSLSISTSSLVVSPLCSSMAGIMSIICTQESKCKYYSSKMLHDNYVLKKFAHYSNLPIVIENIPIIQVETEWVHGEL